MFFKTHDSTHGYDKEERRHWLCQRCRCGDHLTGEKHRILPLTTSSMCWCCLSLLHFRCVTSVVWVSGVLDWEFEEKG